MGTGVIPVKIRRTVRNGVTVLALSELVTLGGHNAEWFESAVLDQSTDDNFVVLDVSRVEFFDSDGMDRLLSLRHRLAERNGALVLAGVSRSVREVFQLAGLDNAFHIFPDVDRAVLGLLRITSGSEVWH